MNTFTFVRLLGSLFGARPSAQTQAGGTPDVRPIVVGQEDRNERHVTVAGQAMLFRDEGGVVVQFRPAFGLRAQANVCRHEADAITRAALGNALRAQWHADRCDRRCDQGGSVAGVRSRHFGAGTVKRIDPAPRRLRQRDDAIVDAVVSSSAPQASETPRRSRAAAIRSIERVGREGVPRRQATRENLRVFLRHARAPRSNQCSAGRGTSPCDCGSTLQDRRSRRSQAHWQNQSAGRR